MKVGLYFGSFNPVHHAHLIIASHIINESYTDEVWFIVSPQNPFKEKRTLLNEQHRLNLVQTAIEGENRMKASNIEFKLPRPSYTIDTIMYLEEKYPEHTFYIILGSDGLQNLEKWKNFSVLAKKVNFIVYPRPGFDPIIPSGITARITDAPLFQISSTHIRKLIKNRKSIRYLVPESVREMIENNGYYSSSLENEA